MQRRFAVAPRAPWSPSGRSAGGTVARYAQTVALPSAQARCSSLGARISRRVTLTRRAYFLAAVNSGRVPRGQKRYELQGRLRDFRIAAASRGVDGIRRL